MIKGFQKPSERNECELPWENLYAQKIPRIIKEKKESHGPFQILTERMILEKKNHNLQSDVYIGKIQLITKAAMILIFKYFIFISMLL